MSYQLYSVPRGCGEVPDTVLPAGIVVGVIRAENLSYRRRQLVFAAALLTVMAILVQGEAVMA